MCIIYGSTLENNFSRLFLSETDVVYIFNHYLTVVSIVYIFIAKTPNLLPKMPVSILSKNTL